MPPKSTYVIDGDRFATLQEFFEEVSRVLIPGVGWGRNLDAFNDILGGGFGTPDAGFLLVWANVDRSRDRLGKATTVAYLQQHLEELSVHTEEDIAQIHRDQLRPFYSGPDQEQKIEEEVQERLPVFRQSLREAAARVQAAERGEGGTLFDWIVNIVGRHPHIQLRLQ